MAASFFYCLFYSPQPQHGRAQKHQHVLIRAANKDQKNTKLKQGQCV